MAIEGREDDAHAGDARDRGKHLDRMEHHWLAGDGEVLLGNGIAYAGALPCGGDDGEDFRHEGVGLAALYWCA